jgi:hypothetical protein
MNSYQKLKQKYAKERRELIDDIITLVEKGDSFDGLNVKSRWKMRLEKEKSVMLGECSHANREYTGLLNAIMPPSNQQIP